jgi:hypothetical protein
MSTAAVVINQSCLGSSAAMRDRWQRKSGLERTSGPPHRPPLCVLLSTTITTSVPLSVLLRWPRAVCKVVPNVWGRTAVLEPDEWPTEVLKAAKPLSLMWFPEAPGAVALAAAITADIEASQRLLGGYRRGAKRMATLADATGAVIAGLFLAWSGPDPKGLSLDKRVMSRAVSARRYNSIRRGSRRARC